MKEKINKKNSIKYIFVGYIIFMIILVVIMLSSLFEVNCGISLKEDSIEYGQNVTLEFHINNNLFFVDLNYVVFEYWIEQNHSIVLNETKISLPNINSFNSYEDEIIISTYELEKGDYRVWTQLTYSMGKGRKGVGNREAKLLSWELSIV